jgi:hypothetical protein
LNEILVCNDGIAPDQEGRWSSWVELANPTEVPFDLTGLSLSSGAAAPRQWVFPSGSTIPPNGFLVLWCDPTRSVSTTAIQAMNTGLPLSRTSGAIWLFDSANRQIDSLEYGQQVSNRSLGRTGAQWRLLTTPTVGAPNSTVAALGANSELRINEWMSNPAAGEDWVELHNTSSLPVSLGGLYLTDDPSLAGRTNTQIRNHSYIAAGGYALFIADGRGFAGANHTNFKLDAGGEALRLYTDAFALIDAADFPLSTLNVSRGRYPDGAATQINFSTTPSPGAANYLDSDRDALPDAWEIAHSLNHLVADAALDTDGDGLTNADEFALGTDPRDPASRFSTIPSSSIPGEMLIRFTAQPGRTYTVQFKNSLGETSWHKLTDIAAGEAVRELEVRDNPGEEGARFYRVVTPREP